MRHPKKATLAILALLLSVNAGLALPVPPDTVVAVPYTGVEAEGDQGGFILLIWNAVEGADGYRIYREIAVATGTDEQGNLVEQDPPETALVPWGFVEPEAGGPVVRVVVATVDSDWNSLWAVTTVQNTDDGPVESEPVYFHVQVEGIATGVQARSWGAVKAALRQNSPTPTPSEGNTQDKEGGNTQ